MDRGAHTHSDLAEAEWSLGESNKSNEQAVHGYRALIDYLIYAITSIFLIIVIYWPNVCRAALIHELRTQPPLARYRRSL